MYKVSVEQSFRAKHAVTVKGVDEKPHFHDWKVVVLVSGPSLDEDGLLVDFLQLEASLARAVNPLQDADLNACDAMQGKNPSAEHVAIYIADCLKDAITSPNKVETITVTEAPHCKAIFHP